MITFDGDDLDLKDPPCALRCLRCGGSDCQLDIESKIDATLSMTVPLDIAFSCDDCGEHSIIFLAR